jgi:NAD-dependent deacetylase
VIIPEETRAYIKENFKKGKVACLTGAGISAESGIPTFRGKGGLWERYDPETYANAEGLLLTLRTQPAELVNFIADFYAVLLKARPNPGHLSLAVLEKEGMLSSVITQNIDNLHQQAGSLRVIELHGNAFRITCAACQQKITLEKEKLEELVRLLKINKGSYRRILRVLSRYFSRCNCGFRRRIDIVLFGEMLPEDELSRAYTEIDQCKTFLIIGSSLAVYPAAGLPLYAKKRGAKLIEINNETSFLSELCDCRITARASEVLPEILEILKN